MLGSRSRADTVQRAGQGCGPLVSDGAVSPDLPLRPDTTGAPLPGPAPEPTPLHVVRNTWFPRTPGQPQALSVSYVFTPPATRRLTRTRVDFVGRRSGPLLDDPASPGPREGAGDDAVAEEFTVSRIIEPLPRGIGPVAVTARPKGLRAGTYTITATPVDVLTGRERRDLPRGIGQGETVFAPLAMALSPGVRFGAWPAMVLLGVLLGLSTEIWLAGHLQQDRGALLVVSVLGSMLGAVGARLYYLTANPTRPAGGSRQQGMSVQGFVLGALAGVVTLAPATGLSLLRALDLSAAAFLVGMAVGRFGCLFAGCCAGRPSSSRWAVFSSNRSCAVRRIPVQVMEAAGAGVLAAGVVTGLRADHGHTPGLYAVAGLSAYTALRQVLFPLRENTHTRAGRLVTLLLVCAAAGAMVLLFLSQE